jgi:hypothetical protein
MTWRVLPSVGETVEVTGIMDDPDPMPVGARGTVTLVNGHGADAQICVRWHDSSRSLMLLPFDPFKIIS